jgi:hypothetical protein
MRCRVASHETQLQCPHGGDPRAFHFVDSLSSRRFGMAHTIECRSFTAIVHVIMVVDPLDPASRLRY